MLLGACGGSAAPHAAPTPHRVRYRLDWVWDDGRKQADSDAWEVTNDLGYRVRVTRGYVTSYSMELVECPKSAPLSLLGWPLLAATAYAGHSSGTPNPAAIRPMLVESLLQATPREAGSVLLPPQAYCQLHYLVARAANDASGLPADLDMVDASLHVDGTYQAPGSSGATPFSIHTAIAYGGLFDHTVDSPAMLQVDTGRGATQVTVRRHAGRMFDGVDFARMTDQVAAGQILRSLIDHADVEIQPLDEHA